MLTALIDDNYCRRCSRLEILTLDYIQQFIVRRMSSFVWRYERHSLVLCRVPEVWNPLKDLLLWSLMSHRTGENAEYVYIVSSGT